MIDQWFGDYVFFILRLLWVYFEDIICLWRFPLFSGIVDEVNWLVTFTTIVVINLDLLTTL